MSKQYLYFILYLLVFSTQVGYSQLSVTSGASSGDIQVCIDSQTVDITLSANSTITGSSIDILLPPGISYTAGSVVLVSNPSGISITESNISNLQQPSFSFTGTMNIGETCVFRISRSADCRAIAYRDLGNTLVDSVFVTYNNPGTTIANNLGNVNTTVIPFGLNEALVSLSGPGGSGAIPSVQGDPGDIIIRGMSITNGGLGCVKVVEFYTVDAAIGIQINQIAITGLVGTLGANPPALPIVLTAHTVNGDTSFYTLDVEVLFGVGAQLCNGERIVIEETIEILSCFSNSGDGETRYGTYWECITRCQTINTATANVSIPPGVPNLVFSNQSVDDNPDCFDSQIFTKTFRVTNTGTRNAVNVVFAVEVRAVGGSATLLVANSSTITLSSGGGPTAIVANPFGPKKATYTLDSIPAGQFIELQMDVEHPCPTTCGRYLYDGYRLEDIVYEDACGANFSIADASFTSNREFNAVNPLENNFPAIADGQTRTFTSTIASIRGLTSTSTLFWEVILPPCGVVFNNSPGDIDWGGTAPTSVTISGDTIRAEFAVASSNQFNNIPFNIVLSGVCGNCGTNQVLTKRLLVNSCPSNSAHCKICLYEVSEGLTIEQCTVGGSCVGAAVNGFEFVRTNLGLPDNNNDRLPDASGSLNLSTIDRSRFIVLDTAEATINATIFISSGNPVLNHAYGEFTIDDNWDFLDASIEVFDASTGTSFTCTGATATSTLSGGGTKRTYVIDVSPNTLGATCPSMSGFVFENGDSIVVRANLVNLLNGTDIFSGIVYPIDFYVSEVANPTLAQKLSCGSNAYSEIYTVYNINPGLDIAGIGTFSSCGERQIDLEFEARTGANIQDFNIFPNEWRPIAYPDTVRMVMPTGYNYVSARLSSFIGVPNNIAIEPLDPNADTLVFVVGQLYQPGGIPSNPVQELIPDGIERSEVQVFIQATCATPDNVNVPITMIMDAFHPLPQLQSLELLDTVITETNLNWNKPNITLTNVSSQTSEGTSTTIEWDIRLTNTTGNSDAANVFLSVATPSGNVSITSIEHIAANGAATGPTALTQVNNIWEFGDINRNVFHDFRVTATYSQCLPDTFFMLAGFDCPAYPTSLSAYNSTCEIDSLPLFTDPKAGTLQLNPIATGVTDDICDTLIYSFTLNSADLANVLNPFLDLTLPQGVILLGDPIIEYPLGTPARAFTATLSGQNLSVDLSAADAQIPGTHSIATNGLFGTREASNAAERQATLTFRFRTTCDFRSGSSFYLQPRGISPCGSPAGGSNLTSFEPPILISGLVPPYNVSTDIVLVGNTTCTDTVQGIVIEMIPDGASTGRDTGFFDLPENIVYAGNFVCAESNGALCPTFGGVINYPNGSSSVTVRYPSTWSLGDTINFSFDVNTAGFTGCSASELITVSHTVTMAGPTCDADGSACGDVKVITGQANLIFSVEKPDFSITNARASTNAVSNGQAYSVDFDVTNNGLDAPAGLIAEFYCADAAGNPTGALLHTHTITVPIGNSQTVRQNVTFVTPVSCDNLNGMVISIAQTTSTAMKQCMCEDDQALITDIPTNVDLPVDWLFFNGKKVNNNAATLTWGTATETNSLGFEIEHAKPTGGLPEFEMVGFVQSTGNPATGAYYEHDVKNLAPGVHYFRLRQIDTDGSEEYSEIRAVVITGSKSEFKIYPTLINPENQVLYLYSPEDGDVVVEIYSILGQEAAILYTGKVTENSLNEISLNTRQFSSGHYVVRVRTSQTIFTQKISIIR